MKLSDNKKLFIGVIIFIGFLIIMHGNEIGQFRNTDKVDATLYPVLYVVCLIPLLIFFGKTPKEFSLKDKILARIIILILAIFPMLVLSGLVLWIDYYTTNKQWKVEEVTIMNKSTQSHSRGPDTYLYNVKTRNTTIYLNSSLNFPVEKVLSLKICKTNSGMIIGDQYYP